MDRIVQSVMMAGAVLLVVGLVAIWGVVEYKVDARMYRRRWENRR
jgi:hypothetical protein